MEKYLYNEYKHFAKIYNMDPKEYYMNYLIDQSILNKIDLNQVDFKMKTGIDIENDQIERVEQVEPLEPLEPKIRNRILAGEWKNKFKSYKDLMDVNITNNILKDYFKFYVIYHKKYFTYYIKQNDDVQVTYAIQTIGLNQSINIPIFQIKFKIHFYDDIEQTIKSIKLSFHDPNHGSKYNEAEIKDLLDYFKDTQLHHSDFIKYFILLIQYFANAIYYKTIIEYMKSKTTLQELFNFINNNPNHLLFENMDEIYKYYINNQIWQVSLLNDVNRINNLNPLETEQLYFAIMNNKIILKILFSNISDLNEKLGECWLNGNILNYVFKKDINEVYNVYQEIKHLYIEYLNNNHFKLDYSNLKIILKLKCLSYQLYSLTSTVVGTMHFYYNYSPQRLKMNLNDLNLYTIDENTFYKIFLDNHSLHLWHDIIGMSTNNYEYVIYTYSGPHSIIKYDVDDQKTELFDLNTLMDYTLIERSNSINDISNIKFLNQNEINNELSKQKIKEISESDISPLIKKYSYLNSNYKIPINKKIIDIVNEIYYNNNPNKDYNCMVDNEKFMKMFDVDEFNHHNELIKSQNDFIIKLYTNGKLDRLTPFYEKMVSNIESILLNNNYNVSDIEKQNIITIYATYYNFNNYLYSSSDLYCIPNICQCITYNEIKKIEINFNLYYTFSNKIVNKNLESAFYTYTAKCPLRGYIIETTFNPSNTFITDDITQSCNGMIISNQKNCNLFNFGNIHLKLFDINTNQLILEHDYDANYYNPLMLDCGKYLHANIINMYNSSLNNQKLNNREEIIPNTLWYYYDLLLGRHDDFYFNDEYKYYTADKYPLLRHKNLITTLLCNVNTITCDNNIIQKQKKSAKFTEQILTQPQPIPIRRNPILPTIPVQSVILTHGGTIKFNFLKYILLAIIIIIVIIIVIIIIKNSLIDITK